MAWLETHVALCAEKGNTNIKVDQARQYCSTLQAGQQYDQWPLINDLKKNFEQDPHVCNGDSFSLMLTKGDWDYKGYSGKFILKL